MRYLLIIYSSGLASLVTVAGRCFGHVWAKSEI